MISVDSEAFKCLICHEIVTDAVMCTDCSALSCQQCLNTWKQTRNHCPVCRKRTKTVRLRKFDGIHEQCRSLAKPKASMMCSAHDLEMNYACLDCKELFCADCKVIDNKHVPSLLRRVDN